MEVEVDAFALDTFERLVQHRSYDQAVQVLVATLYRMDSEDFTLYTTQDRCENELDQKQLMTRYVAAIASMISDPSFEINEQVLLHLLIYKRVLVSLFAATPYSDMSYLVGLVGQLTGSGQVEFKGWNSIYKLLLVSSVYSDQDLVLDTLKAAPKGLKLPYWISLLDAEAVFDEDADELRNRLLGETAVLQGEAPSGDNNLVVRLTHLWMFCSYFTSPDKHRVKKYLNGLLSQWMKKSGVSQPAVSRTGPHEGKPRLLVVSELFKSGHAMYRCFGPSIGQLRSRFHTVLAGRPGCFDEKSAALFDEVLEIEDDLNAKKIIGQICKAKADVIYYPSLGMHSYAILASQVRLAPIQILNLGHPATSCSEHMDYVFVEEAALGDPETLSETIVLKNEGPRYNPPDDMDLLPAAEIRENPVLIRVAVPAGIFKLNAKFLRSCSNIAANAHRPIEFHFFPACQGIKLQYVTAMIHNILPGSKVHPYMSYPDYMGLINHCDVHFSTFPFGLTNGIVDSAMCGLPILALDGPEVHSRADIALQRTLGLPDWLTATTVEEFEDAAVRLVDNDELRLSISRSILDSSPASLFFAEHHASEENFVDLMHWIYRNHEAMQNDGRKIWREEDYIAGSDLGD